MCAHICRFPPAKMNIAHMPSSRKPSGLHPQSAACTYPWTSYSYFALSLMLKRTAFALRSLPLPLLFWCVNLSTAPVCCTPCLFVPLPLPKLHISCRLMHLLSLGIKRSLQSVTLSAALSPHYGNSALHIALFNLPHRFAVTSVLRRR